ncbi:MAG: hypothetical protein HYT22_04060 [Candidatus Niyogibacteria bacterium]|nr:hypothetical protein [Candidatus Niyogibacteria bacterium]
MKSAKDNELKLNQNGTTMLVFMESYNASIPAGFPHASAKALKHFQSVHPALFKHGDEWSIDKHRKHLMDWLSSYRDGV